MSRLHALFDNPAQARAALERLAADSTSADAIEIRSSVPLGHDVVPGADKFRSRAPLFAVLGGLAGGACTIALSLVAARSYEMAAGGMPTIAVPPLMIVTFEGTALGAILFTVATVLIECGLPRLFWSPDPFDEQLAEGKIVITVRGAADASREWVSAALASAVDPVPAGD